MGFNPFKAVTKPLKKVFKSDLGKAAIGLGAFLYGPKLFGTANIGGKGGWGQAFQAFKSMPAWKQALIVGGTTAAGSQLAPDIEEKVDIDVDDPKAHANYLTNRGQFEDEWADWIVAKGDADTKEEA